MITINVNDAASQMQHLIARVLSGESVIFYKDDVPVAEMKPVESSVQATSQTQKKKPFVGNPPFPMKFDDSAFEPLPESFWNAFKDSEDGN